VQAEQERREGWGVVGDLSGQGPLAGNKGNKEEEPEWEPGSEHPASVGEAPGEVDRCHGNDLGAPGLGDGPPPPDGRRLREDRR
jgi:hypothetical protein